MAPPSEPPAENRVLTIRPNRIRLALIAAVGVPLALFLVVLDPVGEHRWIGDFLLSLAAGALLGVGLNALTLLFRRPLPRFDPVARRIVVPSNAKWRSTAVYPGRGFDRIEYSADDHRIRQVRSDGTGRRLPFHRFLTDRRDWEALVDLLLIPPAPPASARAQTAKASAPDRTEEQS